VFINVAGGMTVDEPAADLAVVGAVASSLRNRPIKPGTAVFGEIGLAGEIRGTSQAALRLREAAQMGFTRIVVPDGNVALDEAPPGCEIVPVKNVGDALDQLMDW
jgi:DNA repair protein RadA/Sms